ncbi:unnamed protein product, partial [Candidula unifasciata]
TGANQTASNSAPQATDKASVGSGSASISAVKRSKACKRKKRKDPKEPQKPVSAYALFFRDSQAGIKGHNPSASFGEVSKIVASLWDQLNPEHKEVYKKKTEVAKKQYLKQLAAYRASQVSQQHHQFNMGQATSSTESHCTSQHSPVPGPVYTYPPHVDQVRLASYPEPMVVHSGYEMSTTGENPSRAYPQYPDHGCSQYPGGHPGWDTEYYNSESVIPQCRDVLTSWVGPASSTNTFPVK